MALKLYKPITNAMRGYVAVDKSDLYKGRPEKALTVGKKKTGGRDSSGHATSRNLGGGHKRKLRIVDFVRNTDNDPASVERIEYCPNRTAYIALIKYTDGKLAYILASSNMKAGDKVVSGVNVDAVEGNCLPLSNMPLGTIVHNIELKPGAGGKLIRTAGSSAQILGRDGDYVLIKLRSGEVRKILGACRGTVGVLSNPDNKNKKIGKAGRNRWKGRRPHVRGVAMNPVDHPHGGGEGKTSGGRHPVSRTAVPAKGYKTRSKNKPSSSLIVQSRHKKKK
jgi:large subunit ribosomal protein L2